MEAIKQGLSIDRITEIARSLNILHLVRGIPGTEEYTLLGRPIGDSGVTNSPFAARQLDFIFALKGDHPLITEFLSKGYQEQKSSQEEFYKKLIEAKVLSGLKVLDMGCGDRPTFARVARAAGATVYTVDIISSDDFDFNANKESFRRGESEFHIVQDLEDVGGSIANITQISGGNFDLVTSAHLETVGVFSGKEIATKILKKGGVYFSPHALDDEIIVA